MNTNVIIHSIVHSCMYVGLIRIVTVTVPAPFLGTTAEVFIPIISCRTGAVTQYICFNHVLIT